MVQLTSSKGIEADICLDFDKVCEYESAHPDWSILIEMKGFGKTMRFSTLNLLVSLTTYQGGWKEWANDGFTIEDLTKVLAEGLEELGFTSEGGPSQE